MFSINLANFSFVILEVKANNIHFLQLHTRNTNVVILKYRIKFDFSKTLTELDNYILYKYSRFNKSFCWWLLSPSVRPISHANQESVNHCHLRMSGIMKALLNSYRSHIILILYLNLFRPIIGFNLILSFGGRKKLC